MNFVATQYPLPSVTGKNGAIVPMSFAPGRCAIDSKRGIRGGPPKSAKTITLKTPRSLGSIRAAVPRTRLTVVPSRLRSLGEVAGFWDSLAQGIKGAAAGFAVGGPAGAVVGGAGGAIAGSTGKGKNAQQQAVVSQQQLGPLANISTGTIVGIAFGFSALLLVLAKSGGR